MIHFEIDTDKYLNEKPFPHLIVDNILDDELAKGIQKEILEIDDKEFDRYDNPFEQKWTLRNKNNMPSLCNKLFDYLQSNECINKLSQLVGIQLINDSTRNFWGIHKYDDGDKLDIHVDAGIHPTLKLKKEITLGIYLSKDWNEENGGYLELWEGENSVNDDAKLVKCIHSVLPIFNRMVIFTCNDYSWHGNPMAVRCKNGEKRIFLTISYLSQREKFDNKRQKAFFVRLPDEVENKEKDKLRLIRADSEKYKEVYRTII